MTYLRRISVTNFSLLIQEFRLQTQYAASFHQVSPLFLNWTSEDPRDTRFGASTLSPQSDLSGTNGFFFIPPSADQKLAGRVLDRMIVALDSKLPTRFVCLVPSSSQPPQRFIELVRFAPRAPLVTPWNPTTEIKTEMSLVLGANKESLLIDPITWTKFIHRLTVWAQESDLIVINSDTDALFRERKTPEYPPRSISSWAPSVLSIYNFFDISSDKQQPTKSKGLFPPIISNLIDKVNRHKSFLGVLGILPNQLRTLLKQCNYHDYENDRY